MVIPDPELTRSALNRAEVEQIKILAKQIVNTKQFRGILRDADPKMRRAVYDLLVPLLTIRVAPYEKLMRAQLRREKGKGTSST